MHTIMYVNVNVCSPVNIYVYMEYVIPFEHMEFFTADYFE